MGRSEFDLAAEFAGLECVSLVELREAWRRLYQTPPPARLSRDLLLRGIAYRLQERAFGGLSRLSRRWLQPGSEEASHGRARLPRVSLKPGTQLVREWHGVTHTVVVLADGVAWRGQRYKSLSVVARQITGAHWSGPRFFGLKAGASDG
jgi:Protein of unknown function (DUF2924)